MARIVYARVSSLDQDLDGQLARLKQEGCTITRFKKVSDASRDGRPELETILQFLRAGDELVVTRLDRLGRDTRDVLNLIHECEQRGASVTVLDPHVSTRGEMGHVVLTVLGMVAQMERRFIKERQREGIERRRAKAGILVVSDASIAQQFWPGRPPAKASRLLRPVCSAAACRFTACSQTARRSASRPIMP